MPMALAAPIAAAVAGSALSAGVASAMKPGGPPEISGERKKALGTFAERLAAEEGQFNEPGGGYLLRPGGRPIAGFNVQNRPNQLNQRIPAGQKLTFK